MLRQTGTTRVMSGRPGGVGADDELLRAVKEAAAHEYDILGELGRGAGGRVIYLARELATAKLVALRLEPDGDGYALTVVRELDASIPPMGGVCPKCRAPLVGWGRFCAQCGSDITGAQRSDSAPSRQELLDAVKSAAQGEYEILGEMDRAEGGGVVYFARDVATGRIVALRLQKDSLSEPDGAESYSLGVTQVMKPLVASMGATYASPTSAMAPVSAAEPPAAPTETQSPRAQPSPARATPQAVLLPAEEAPKDEVLPPLPPKKTPGWVIGAIAGVVAGVFALGVFVQLRSSPDGTQARVGAAGSGASAALQEGPGLHEAAAPAVRDSGHIEIAASLPRGATVTIDGEVLTHSPVTLPPGEYALSASAPGYVSVTERVRLDTGQTLVWTPVMAPVRSAAVPAASHRTAPPPHRRTQSAAPAATSDTPAPPTLSCDAAYAAKNWSAALTACSREAGAGSVVAERNLGVMYDQGLGVGRDPAQALSWYRKAADAGGRDAAYQLGRMYASGRGVQADPREAVTWYRKAALLGDEDAQLDLAAAYENGTGVDKNIGEAVGWYTKAAQQGSAKAQNYLGWLYGNGKGVRRDDGQAVKWFRLAADQGNAQAQYNLGFMYANGRGVERDDAEAVSWFRKSAKQGYRDAIAELRQRGISP